jgi:hypothetical protein
MLKKYHEFFYNTVYSSLFLRIGAILYYTLDSYDYESYNSYGR